MEGKYKIISLSLLCLLSINVTKKEHLWAQTYNSGDNSNGLTSYNNFRVRPWSETGRKQIIENQQNRRKNLAQQYQQKLIRELTQKYQQELQKLIDRQDVKDLERRYQQEYQQKLINRQSAKDLNQKYQREFQEKLTTLNQRYQQEFRQKFIGGQDVKGPQQEFQQKLINLDRKCQQEFQQRLTRGQNVKGRQQNFKNRFIVPGKKPEIQQKEVLRRRLSLPSYKRKDSWLNIQKNSSLSRAPTPLSKVTSSLPSVQKSSLLSQAPTTQPKVTSPLPKIQENSSLSRAPTTQPEVTSPLPDVQKSSSPSSVPLPSSSQAPTTQPEKKSSPKDATLRSLPWTSYLLPESDSQELDLAPQKELLSTSVAQKIKDIQKRIDELEKLIGEKDFKSQLKAIRESYKRACEKAEKQSTDESKFSEGCGKPNADLNAEFENILSEFEDKADSGAPGSNGLNGEPAENSYEPNADLNAEFKDILSEFEDSPSAPGKLRSNKGQDANNNTQSDLSSNSENLKLGGIEGEKIIGDEMNRLKNKFIEDRASCDEIDDLAALICAYIAFPDCVFKEVPDSGTSTFTLPDGLDAKSSLILNAKNIKKDFNAQLVSEVEQTIESLIKEHFGAGVIKDDNQSVSELRQAIQQCEIDESTTTDIMYYDIDKILREDNNALKVFLQEEIHDNHNPEDVKKNVDQVIDIIKPELLGKHRDYEFRSKNKDNLNIGDKNILDRLDKALGTLKMGVETWLKQQPKK
ncbi:MAG: hypothetical protein LBB11_02030 [Puniceicoccales bacterium]|jgi:hypothetical protein|nr:hypothetical protein [Puniceicoccales bacterium]